MSNFFSAVIWIKLLKNLCGFIRLQFGETFEKKILPLTAKSIIFTFAIMRLALKVIDCKKMKIMEKIWLKKKRIINSLRKSYIFLYTVFYNFFSYCMIQKCFFFFFDMLLIQIIYSANQQLCLNSCYLGDFIVEKGTHVVVDVFSIHYDPTI